jgi:hypothetical protein
VCHLKKVLSSANNESLNDDGTELSLPPPLLIRAQSVLLANEQNHTTPPAVERRRVKKVPARFLD